MISLAGDFRDRVDTPVVSFVVIAHNEEAVIEQTLESIRRQAGLGTYEILVIDDGSTDDTARVVAELAKRHSAVRLIRTGSNRGRGFARHSGVDHAGGRYIAMVDGDILLPPDWLRACLTAIADHDAVGGTAVPDGDTAYVARRLGLDPKPHPHRTVVTGSNALYRREVFDLVSFDPRLRDGEDVALNHALQRIGARLHTVSGLTVRHQEQKGLPATLRWMYQSGQGASRQLYCYRSIRAPDLAFAGWVATIIAPLLLRRRSFAIAVLLAYLGAASLGHIRGAFVWNRRKARAFGVATIVDMAVLGSYFAGRAVGLARSRRSACRNGAQERSKTGGTEGVDRSCQFR